MRYSYLLGLAALAAASDVHELHKKDFDSWVGEHNLALIEFFAPWCGHCKALAPEYEEAATTLKDKDIALAKVDCTEEADLCQEFGVEGYPTLKIFRGKENISPYSGPRKAQAIVSYMTKQSLPAVSPILTSEALTEFKAADKVVLVGYFGADDKSSNTTFGEVAEALRDNYLFGATSDAALAEAEGVKQPSIVLYKSFDEGKNEYTKKFSVADITEFAKTSAIPLVGEVGPETYSDYMEAGIPLAYIFAESADEREELSKTLKSVAEEYKGKINFATIDAAAFGQHAGNLNLEVGKWPAFAIQDIAKNQKFPFETAGDASALSVKSIGKFVKDFVGGKIEPSIKSEPIPEKQEGPVTIIVAKNYEDVVIKNEKDVLVEFYAPWCGHCKALAPKYDELAGMYKNFADKVTIAKVDATANDVPDEIAGFPTIKLFKSGSKSDPIEYTGSRTVEDLANFIRDNGSHHVEAVTDDAATDPIDTEGMPQQAAAATESVKSKAGDKAADATESAKSKGAEATEKVKEKVGDKIKEKVKEGAQVVKEAILDGDDDLDEHDEL